MEGPGRGPRQDGLLYSRSSEENVAGAEQAEMKSGRWWER